MLDRGKLRVYDRLVRDKPPKAKCIVDRLIFSKANNLISGDGGEGKSWFVQDMAICIATATPFLGVFGVEEPRKVLYIDAEHCSDEEDDEAVRRFSMLHKGRGLGDRKDLPISLYPEPIKLDDEDTAGELISLIQDEGFEVVILDPQIVMHSGDENSSKDMSNLLQKQRSIIRATGCTFITLVHTRKASRFTPKNVGDMIRGSTTNRDDGDSHLYLKKDGAAVRVVHDKCKRGREVDDFMVEYEFAPDDSSIRLEYKPLDKGSKTTEKDIATAFILEALKEGKAYRRELATVAEEKGIRSFKTALDSLVKRKGIVRETEGREAVYSLPPEQI